jgi:hypothetical protein
LICALMAGCDSRSFSAALEMPPSRATVQNIEQVMTMGLQLSICPQCAEAGIV